MWIIWLFIGVLSLQEIACQCTFPATLAGTWVSSNDGTWVINSTHILNFYTLSSTTGNTISPGVSQVNFECYENQGDTKYAIKSEPFDLLGGQRSVHTCIDIREISANKLLYYHATEADPSGFQFTINPDYDKICNLASYEFSYNYHIALKSGTETTALQNCPSSLFGSYNYDTCADPNATDTSLNACDTRQQLIFNYTLCNTPQMFSLEGVLDCVHHNTSGSISYLTLYNRDSTSPDNNNYFRYVCLAVALSGSNVAVTANPNKCNDNQQVSTIDPPGEALTLTPYYLCPITTEETSKFDILPIIIGVVVALVLLALIALIIYCCCTRKCRKKKSDEEEALSESESEDEQKKSDSRRSSKSSHEDEEERKSIDSGISEPPVSGRTDSNNDMEGDTKGQEQELVINAEGDKEFEDKNSRPCSGQRSRMSDLPPSTVPPDDDQPLSHRSEEDQVIDGNTDDEGGPEQQADDKVSEKADESDHEPEQTEHIEEDAEDEVKSENKESGDEEQDLQEDKDEDDEQKSETNEDVKQDINESQTEGEDSEPEQEAQPHEEDEQTEQGDEEEEQKQTDVEVPVYVKGDPGQRKADDEDSQSEDHEQTKKNEDTESHKESDEETKRDKRGSSDEDEADIQRRLIGGKKGKDYLTTGALTTVLVSREEEERKRQKINSKSKKQKMKKLAQKKTKKFGIRGGKGGRHRGESDDDNASSSDDEMKRRGLREAPFMKQYEDKKHIEHILDEQHYWSDPEADKDFRINDDMSSIFNSEYSSDSEEEIIGADGVVIRVKKSKHDKRRKRGEGDDISNADSEYMRQKMLKRAGSVDSMVSVEEPDNSDQKRSKRRPNEHVMKMETDEDMSGEKTRSKTGDTSGKEEDEDDQKGGLDRNKDDKLKGDTVANSKFSLNKSKTILVKEHSDMTDDSLDEKGRKSKKKSKRALNGKDTDEDLSEFCDTDIDKLSDRDSGMDDEDREIDVLLTQDQQQMIVNMLFDEDMNLRPQFGRDENGRIVRRVDNTVVFDPHTGRFTYRKRLGQIFKVPRLKRSDKGRPLGGYIEDDFGPKQEQNNLRRKTSSARKSQSGKSGKSGRLSGNARSPSADLKRVRTDGRNVGFSVPDEDIDTITDDQLEFNKRGRRDIGSAIRRQLNKRLFRKKRKLGPRGAPGALPEIKVRKAWGEDDHLAAGFVMGGPGGVSTLPPRGGRYIPNSPWAQRKTSTLDTEQRQMYREGLQSDRRILENLQDKLNTGERPFAPREAFVESGGEIDDEHEHHGDEHQHGFDRGYSYYNDDGKLVIRERGCPELKQKKVPLFTIIRRPGDLELSENANDDPTNERNVKSAPLQLQDVNTDATENEPNEGSRYPSDSSLVARSNDGRDSQMTSIDDNRLRRLLEELYKDKKYFDKYIESKDPLSAEFTHSKGLAEHGRGYLLKRADYWERRGPLPPRPPMTAVGWKMQRQQTLFNSRQTSELGCSTMTCTPDLSAASMPGVVESPRADETITEENDSRNSPNESFV